MIGRGGKSLVYIWRQRSRINAIRLPNLSPQESPKEFAELSHHHHHHHLPRSPHWLSHPVSRTPDMLSNVTPELKKKRRDTQLMRGKEKRRRVSGIWGLNTIRWQTCPLMRNGSASELA